MKKILNLFLACVVSLWSVLLPVVAYAQETTPNAKVNMFVFGRDDCSHCIAQKEFLDTLISERSDLNIEYIDVTDPKNEKLWNDVTSHAKISKVTPTNIIGYDVIQGFESEDTTGKMIKETIDRNSINVGKTLDDFLAQDLNTVSRTAKGTCTDPSVPCTIEPEQKAFYVKIPFVGSVDVTKYSLPTMSMILGFIDGFNPCAMWVLVTFLFMLARVNDRKKMWTFAGLFIVAETIMYYLILTLWFTTWDFVGLNKIITPLVGLLAIGSGVFFLWEWKTSDGTCKVVSSKKRVQISEKIKNLVEQKFTVFTAIGIIGLALSVNVIEFACSIGIPQTFTKILELNNLSFAYTQSMMFLYILFYMFDDFLVFGIALYSFEKIGVAQKYSKACNLVGGILMILLGLMLVFRPDLLVLI